MDTSQTKSRGLSILRHFKFKKEMPANDLLQEAKQGGGDQISIKKAEEIIFLLGSQTTDTEI